MAAMLKLVRSIAGVVHARMTYQPLERVVPVVGSFPDPTPGAENIRHDVVRAVRWSSMYDDVSVRSAPVELPPWT